MHSPIRPPCWLTALIAVVSVDAGEIKFEEQVLVEDVTRAYVVVSPRGAHVAAVIPKGSRQAVIYDGVEGPRFDEIASPALYTFEGMGGQAKRMHDGTGTTQVRALGPQLSGPSPAERILFNPAATHFTYFGRSRTEFAHMVDGKEVHRGEYASVQSLAFSPDGEQVIATATTKEGQQRVLINGQPGPWARSIPDIFFTPDGKHYAYTGTGDDGQPKWMVVDGRQVKLVGQIIGFTPQGLLLTRVDSMAGITLLGNGKPMTQVGSIDHLAIAPKTGKLIMAVKPPLGTPPREKPAVLTVDGQIIPGTEGVNVTKSWFSPDGKRYAVLCQRFSPQPEMFMLVDGKKELSYQSIFFNAPYEPAFSPDSKSFAYVAQAATGLFLVINGEESDGLQGVTFPIWNATGSRMAWGGVTPTQKRVFYIDGRSVALPPRAAANYFRFSPDGARTAWSYGDASGQTIVVDGSPIPAVAGLMFIGADPFDGRDCFIKFSPDGKHIAYPGRDPNNPSRQGIWVNGKFLTAFTRPQVNRVTFTPDSQHVAWAIAGLKDNRQSYQVFVDGREALSYHASMADNTAGTWEMGNDGALTLIGADGDTLKRYRIPAPADSSITTMLASAK